MARTNPSAIRRASPHSRSARDISIAMSTSQTDAEEYPLSARSIGRLPTVTIATMPTSTTCEPGIGCSISPAIVAKNTPTRRQCSTPTPSGGGHKCAMRT